MEITAHIRPDSRAERVTILSPTEVRIWVTEPPREGRANKALIEALSDYLSVPKSSIRIIRGLKSKKKTIRIEGLDTLPDENHPQKKLF